MEKEVKEAISIIEDVRNSMPECTNKSFLKGALNELNVSLTKRTVSIDTSKHLHGKDEIYCNWYVCSNCQFTYIIFGYKYCPDCGSKIEWIGKDVD